MRRTLVASLALALSISALGGSALAQSDPGPTPTSTPSLATAPEITPSEQTLFFAQPEWRRLTTGEGPAGREDHTWTVDGSGRYAYLFGGRDGGREFGDIWRYDLRRDAWQKLAPKGRKPAPRFGHSAVWVEGRGLIVFAGQRGLDFFDDLWVYDPDRRRWRELPAAGQAPKRRYGSCMVVGPDGRLWISHGFTNAGRFDDTRAYHLRRQRWAVITPDGRKPGERCLHDCFTTASGELVLYGGQDDGAFALGDLWLMDQDRTWDRLADPSPAARRLYGVTEAGDVAYLFGGAGEDNTIFDDLWRVDRQTLEFERVRVEGKRPGARYAGTLITDTRRDRILLFGGQASKARSDLWELVDLVEPEIEDGEEEAETGADEATATDPPVEDVPDPSEL